MNFDTPTQAFVVPSLRPCCSGLCMHDSDNNNNNDENKYNNDENNREVNFLTEGNFSSSLNFLHRGSAEREERRPQDPEYEP